MIFFPLSPTILGSLPSLRIKKSPAICIGRRKQYISPVLYCRDSAENLVSTAWRNPERILFWDGDAQKSGIGRPVFLSLPAANRQRNAKRNRKKDGKCKEAKTNLVLNPTVVRLGTAREKKGGSENSKSFFFFFAELWVYCFHGEFSKLFWTVPEGHPNMLPKKTLRRRRFKVTLYCPPSLVPKRSLVQFSFKRVLFFVQQENCP